MKFFPPHEFCSHVATRAARLGAAVACCVWLWGNHAEAQHLQVRTQTVGQATEFLRTDRTVAAQRTLSQSVDVWGYDLIGNRSGTLSGHIAFRYYNEFAFNGTQRANPYLRHDVNRLSIDIATVTWRPVEGFEAQFGRQLSRSIFFTRDFDGVSFRLQVPMDRATWRSSIYGGRHVIGRPDTLNADQYDVQGRPIEDRIESDLGEWIVGARGGVGIDDNRVTVAWERRGYSDVVSAERLGISSVVTPWHFVNVSGSATYHTILRDVDRARFNVAVRAAETWRLSAGAEHVVPIFDSSSIFNLFGAGPSQSYFLKSFHDWKPHRVGARVWVRNRSGGSDEIGDLSNHTTSVGFGLDHRVSLPIGTRKLRLDSAASIQTAGSNSYGATQLIGSLQGTLPIFDHSIRLRARTSGVWVGDDPTTRRDGGGALTQLIGIDSDVSFGELSIAAVGQTSDVLGSRINLFATFTTELRP